MNGEQSFPKSIYKNEKGVLLITTLLLVFVIAILTTSLFARTINERRHIEMETNRIIAFNLAESGIDESITQLADDSGYLGTGVNLITLGKGSYSSAITIPDPTNNPKIRKIISKGYAPSTQATSYAYQERTITAYVNLEPKATFTHAVFAEDEIEIRGNGETDSYDSGQGPYGPDNTTANGDIGTNSVDEDHIQLIGNTSVNGDAIVGPGGDPDEVIDMSDRATINGEKKSAPGILQYDPVTAPSGLASSGEITLRGNDTMTLAAGTYLFDEITITGNGTLNLTGPVTIYVSGDVFIRGNGVVNPGNIPTNFIVNVIGDQSVELSGNGAMYGLVYAPESGKVSDGVRMSGNAELFGAVIAYDFRAVGTANKIHYDETLMSFGASTKSTVSLISWQET